MNYLNISAYFSLIVQILTGFVEAKGIFLDVGPNEKIVQEILTLELIVQFIEFLFYIYLVHIIVSGEVSNAITSHRYFDWSITTPIMLISFMIFFKYLKDPTRKINLLKSIKEEKINIIHVVIANAFMLLFGYLAEISVIKTPLGIALGFIPFAYMFKILYAHYAKGNATATNMFYFIFSIWSFYGVSAALPFDMKNTIYNILDLFAKNAYGLFLYFFLLSKQST